MNVLPLSLKANFSWTFIAEIIYALSKWFLILLLARYQTPQEVGYFSLALAVTGPIVVFTSFQLKGIQATDAGNEYTFSEYFILQIVSGIAGLIIVSLISFILFKLRIALICILIGISGEIESVCSIFYGRMQKEERLDWVSISKIFKSLSSIGLFWVALITTKSLIWAVIGLSVSSSLILITYDINKIKLICDFEIKLNWLKILSLIKKSLPMGFVMLLGSLRQNIPKYLIGYFLGSYSLGIFSAIFYPVIGGIIFISALGNSTIARMAKYFTKYKDKEFNNLLVKLVSMTSVFGILGIVVSKFYGEKLLNIIYGAEYSNYYNIFCILMIGAAITYLGSIGGFIITAKRQFFIQLPINVISTIIMCLFGIFLIPKYGLLGAALSFIITESSGMILYWLIIIFGNIFELKLNKSLQKNSLAKTKI